MNGPTTILLAAGALLALSSFCGASPVLSSARDALAPPPPPAEISGARRRVARSLDAPSTSVLGTIAERIASLPLAATSDAARMLRLLLAWVRSTVRSLLGDAETAARYLLDPVGLLSGAIDVARGWLRGTSSAAIAVPLDALGRSIRSVEDATGRQLGAIIEEATRLGWIFLSTRGLPWMRAGLDVLRNAPGLPAPLRTLILDFDALYDLLRLLGYVQPADS